ncbi:hypothetical protein GPECTOR_2g992 [Gonium pectorale]|uniref:Uncharacterized protein n=1 Tax=Gonium pectorale TaxID=33097 RepID=A0A150H3H5_GONPE|nr:hypothetical protein GPECTOR_2g992 [Gonium pectorale]|eukprot:KXZ56110.1 hypothetical protein GPECTOR_2g992 [Gonium pectorale]
MRADERRVNWGALRAVISTEALKEGGPSGSHGGAAQIDVNSGGRVFFCFFAPAHPGEPEGLAVLKFGPSRLLMQAEQFANELTRHLDICAPDCRIVRQAGASSEEWRALLEACTRLGSSSSAGELAGELSSLPVVLLMEYCPGFPLLECEEAFRSPGPGPGTSTVLNTFEELGRLFLLDTVLGNADRLPCSDLGWRGNPNNVLYGRRGSRYCSHIVAIDSCVQRRPPAARLSAEDAGVDRLAQLLLTDQDVTRDLLRQILAHSKPGLAALTASPVAAAEAFQRGFRECLGCGLLEMMHSKMHDWSMEFISDIKALRPELPIPTPAVAVSGPSPGPSSGGRVVAHYSGLNIRVSAAAGGAGAGPGRSRTPLMRAGGASAAGGNSTGVSPARPARPSPYLAGSANRGPGRSARNPSVGGAGASPDGLQLTPSSVARRRNSLGYGQAAAAAAAAATAGGAHTTDATPQPQGSNHSVTAAAGGGEGSAAGSSAREAVRPNAGRRGGAVQRQRSEELRGAEVDGGNPDPLQQCLRRRVPGVSAASVPNRLAYSPYSVYMPAPAKLSGGAGLSAMALRRRRSPSSGGISRTPSSHSASHSHSGSGNSNGSCGSSAAAAAVTPGSRPAANAAHSPSPLSTPPAACAPDARRPAVGGRGGGCRSGAISPCLPPMRRASSPAGDGDIGSAGAGAGGGAAAAADAPEALPLARRASDVGVHWTPPQTKRHPGAAPPPPPPPPPAGGVLRPSRGGRSVGNSPSRMNPALRIRTNPPSVDGASAGVGAAAAAAALAAQSPSGMRMNRSFGLLRSPRIGLRQPGSPRKNLSPATPKFRSPLVLEPLGPRGPSLGTPAGGQGAMIPTLKSDLSLTMALKSINHEARKDDLLSSRVQHWKEVFRTRGEELKAAVGEWQSRHQLERVLTTGFLDGTHPIVDTYELKIRLEHMLRRLQVLQEAAAAQKPSCVLQPPRGLFVGGAVCADSHHILRHLGITHIVNATEELLLPPPSTGFEAVRVPLRDVDDEDISRHFADVSGFIEAAHASGGSVLVHCSEGKSRSVTLLLAYLMKVKGWRLKAAYDHVKQSRPVACPNAGFMARLLAFERELFGDNSYIPPVKKAKPEPVMCPVCGAAVGISSASLAVHMKRAHPPPAPAPPAPPAAEQAVATAPTAAGLGAPPAATAFGS